MARKGTAVKGWPKHLHVTFNHDNRDLWMQLEALAKVYRTTEAGAVLRFLADHAPRSNDDKGNEVHD